MRSDSFSLYKFLFDFFSEKDQLQKVRSGTVLFQEKDSVEYIYLLVKGSISIGRVHMRGKELILKILHNREILIEYPIFQSDPYYHFFAKTHSDCELLPIKRELFEMFVMNHPEAMNSLAIWLSTSYLKAQMKCQ